MAQQQRNTGKTDQVGEIDEAPAKTDEEIAEAKARDKEVDDLLDEIDSVLEVNAEEFVREYVQKGGE
jgi:ubiquitin-like protein Pup